MDRRKFLGLSSAALIGLSLKSDRPIAGSFVNESLQAGHLLRDRAAFPAPKRIEKIPVVIVGGGIAGLNAAWRLRKRGFTDFVLLEMNDAAGGNARWGENEITAYPWAAHYVPVPGPRAIYVRELFEDLGVFKDGVWNDRYLCFSPQERLFLYGRWQEGIEPAIGLRPRDREQFQRLEDLFTKYRNSGEFTIPLELGRSKGSADLDRISFSDWLSQQGFDSPLVNWYMNYACRDDYGALAKDTSAWAGIHYFSSRETEEKGPLTWPEGNGWITRRLMERVGQNVRTNQMVHRIAAAPRGVTVEAGDTQFQSEFVIFAATTFLAPYIVEGFSPLHDFVYSPWLTANLTLDRIPDARGAEPTWDTVFLDSPTLGYVDATHQSIRSHIDKTVWTFYWALADGDPAQNRRFLLEKDWAYWKEAILNDLERVHSDIRQCVSRIDIMRMGHAMVRPVPGTIFSAERQRLSSLGGRLLFANSDLSGISIFEEAQYQGVEAAQKILHSIAGKK
ncbi:MAG: FAD-dependent oxidoreductase [Candidatus Acidiferrum sp.]